MMVVSETCCEYGAEKPCGKEPKKLLVLTEEQKTAGENKSRNTAEVREIYKYQPADSILREIIQFLGGKEQKQEDVELIGVYFPHFCGISGFIFSCCLLFFCQHQQHLWNRIEKVELPQNNLQFNAAYIGSREGEEMNGFVRTLFTGQAAKNP